MAACKSSYPLLLYLLINMTDPHHLGMEALAGRSNYVYSSTPVADAGAVAVAHIISSIAESLDP